MLDPKNKLILFIHDALRFISAFVVPISESAPQIYLSALPFTPQRSLIGEKFRPRFPNTLTISDGRPSQWPMTVFVAEHHKSMVQCIILSSDEKIFASISAYVRPATMYVCDSETGHCISGPFELRNIDCIGLWGRVDACFSPDGKHILVRSRPYNRLSCRAVVWNIEKGEEVFQIEGFDFVFIHCGRNEGRITSMDWIDENGSLVQAIAPEDQRPTCILVKLWDIGNGIFDRLFEIDGISVAQFSPDGKYLAVERQSESVVELWNLEDGKITHQFSHPPGNILSLHLSPTNDYLTAASGDPYRKCLRRLDIQQMVPLNIEFKDGDVPIPPAVIHSSHTNRVFFPRVDTVEIWEVSTTGSNMVFEIESLTRWMTGSICPSRDGHRLLMGNGGTVRMLSLEDLESYQPVTQDKEFIALSPSGKILATGSRKSKHVELWDTTTWECVGPRIVEHNYGTDIAFSADDNRIAVFSGSLVTIWDINNLENCLSFDPWLGRSVDFMHAAFQTCNDLVICARPDSDIYSSSGSNDSNDSSNFDEMPGLLQVWKVKDHSECIFSLDININVNKIAWRECSRIFLAPDGLTVITGWPVSCYSWNHDTAQFHPFHFADETHLGGVFYAYSPDGKFFACTSPKDYDARVWDTRTGQLCGKPITNFTMETEIVLSPAPNGQSLDDQLITLYDSSTEITTLFGVHTGHLYAKFLNPGQPGMFIRDGTKLMSHNPIRIYDIADLAARYQDGTNEYRPVPQDGWMVGQDDELLFWVPLEHRRVLCPPQVVTIWQRPPKVDFSNFWFGTEWTECIDKEWLKGLEERGKKVGRLLG